MIEGGLLVLVGQKLFADESVRMNLSVAESAGGVLVVSQSTLLASTRKGSKPSWHRVAGPEGVLGRPVATGQFGAIDGGGLGQRRAGDSGAGLAVAGVTDSGIAGAGPVA